MFNRPTPAGTRSRRRAQLRRRGAAVVEFAVCTPVLMLVVFGSIEACSAIYLKQAAATAAYEATRVATGTGGTLFAGNARAHEIVDARNMHGATVTFTPAQETNWTRGTDVTVEVAIPASNNLGGLSLVFQGQSFSSSVTMVKQ